METMFLIAEAFVADRSIFELEEAFAEFCKNFDKKEVLSKFFFESCGKEYIELEGNQASKKETWFLASFLSQVIKPGKETMLALHDDNRGAIYGLEIKRGHIREVLIPQSPMKYALEIEEAA